MPPTDTRTAALGASPGAPGGSAPGPLGSGSTGDTLELRLTEDIVALFEEGEPALTGSPPPGGAGESVLLDLPARWGAVDTPSGLFRLVPVRLERDLSLISRWMNDPAVAAFWELAGPDAVTAGHLRAQLGGDGRAVPCLGVLDGVPMSYWELYRADLDPLARHFPARPHDTGLHLLIGGVTDRGRGIGTTLLGAVSDLVLDHRPRCGRVVAEPDLRNTPSVSAFLGAGFRFSAELDLPGKRAALMIRDRPQPPHRPHRPLRNPL
ncbi:GNAT family N-acetyltransferase [Streptomyces sp. NBC_01498]|uniref:GNAT family N-acetyltransferase n=1 Tax=Streptomyces sp. NBC_01498 TaxID=2975870 RepID=UPI003FCCE306